MMPNPMRSFFILLLAVTLRLPGQVASSSVGGQARDISGAVMVGVRITATEKSTGFSQFALSGPEGLYHLTELRPGVYSISAEKTGFRNVVASNVTLAVNQKGRLDFELSPGADQQSITITSSVSPVQAEEASVGYRTEYGALANLPLLGRNVLSLVTLGPGAIPRQYGGFVSDIITDVQRARGAVALNFPIHGGRTTANRSLIDGALDTDFNAFATSVVPPLESVQEFRIISTFAPAEFPQAGGGVVNIVTKSGGREFHGNAFEFFRNEATDARNFFDSPALPRPIFRNHQFGGSLSGPMPFADTFFFTTYEGVRGKSARSSLNLVPSESLRGGDFSGRNAIFDPYSFDGSSRQPFAGNRIPATRVDSVARAFLDRFQPLPNYTGTTGNFLEATPNEETFDHVSGRVDHQFRSTGRLFGRYTINNERSRIAGFFPLLPTSQRLRAQQAVLGYTTGRASWLSETRLAFTRLRIFSLPESAFRNDIARELGINGTSDDPFTWGLPYFLVTNFNLRTDDPVLPQIQRDNTWQFSENLSRLQGRHTLKMGFQWIGFHLNYRKSNLARGRLTFTGAFTSQVPAGAASGDPFADFLVGLPQVSERNLGAAQADLLQGTWSGYFQDDWRIHSRLTVNLGLRYEYVAPFREQRGRLLNLDYSGLPGPPKLAQVERPVQPDRNDFAPRIGIAARLPRISGAGELVFRAGYGIFYNPEIAIETYDLIRNGVRNVSNRTDGVRPVLTLRDPFPQTATTGLPSYFGIDTNARTPYVQQWDAGFQRELPSQGVLEVVYVGSKGTKLGRFRQFNSPLHVVTGENLQPRPGNLQQLRPFPELGPIIQRQHIASSIYHALEVKAERRFTGPLFLLASFAWSKSIDDADSVIPGQFVSFGAQDERNLRLERGLSVNNVGRRLTVGAVYRFSSSKKVNLLIRDWELSGTAVIQDGTPLNPVYFAFDAANTGTPNRPNVVPGQSVRLSRSERTADHFFNTAAFSTPAPYTFGNAGRNILPGPGNVVLDAALLRRFRITEKLSTTLRAECFNFANHPNWGIPGPYPDFGPFFGKIFASGDPRRFQFSLRFDF
jgi:hypothetical protein